MSEITANKISSTTFDPDAFVRDLTKPSVGVNELKTARNKVHNLADETNGLLKKNVYKNYALFIDTAKEISYLKSEMYQLSHLLTEEQSLLGSLLDISISGDKTHGLTVTEKKEAAAKIRGSGGMNDIESHIGFKLPKSQSAQVLGSSNFDSTNSKELITVLDKIEGFSGILEIRNRVLLQYGELIELDPNDYKPIPHQGPLFGVLLNDCFVMASSLFNSTRPTGKKYKFLSLYELDNIAVVNVKDPNFKTAFKILMFPQTKVFRVDTIELKKSWLDTFEHAKKQRRASLSLQRRDSLLFMSNLSIDGSIGGSKNQLSPLDRPYSSILNPFEEAELLEDVSESDAEMLPLWLIEVPEDLDVCIAQRNFEDAVVLVHKVNDHFALYPKCCDTAMQTDLKLRVNHKIKELIDAVSNELQIAPDRSLQSGPRSARRAVHLLLKLGKSSLATKLFLAQRSALLKFCLRQQKIEGATLQYIKRMSSVFFNNVTETCKEFQKAFDVSASNNNGAFLSLGSMSIVSSETMSITSEKNSPSATSPSLACLVSWIHKQLQHFIGLFSRHVFTTHVSSPISAECVSIIRCQCKKLKSIVGIDILFYLDKELKVDIERIISESRDKLIEAIKLRSAEDKWQPQNHGNIAGINKFVEEMRDSGLSCVQNYVYDECRISLTSNTTSFAKSYLSIIQDLLKLSTDFTHKTMVDALVTTFKAQLKHIDKSYKNDKFKQDIKFIRRNACFILDTLLSLAEQYYSEKVGTICNELAQLHNQYEYLKTKPKTDDKEEEGKRKRSPSKTTINITEGGKTFSTTTYL